MQETVAKINTLEQAAQGLVTLGYDVEPRESSVFVKVGGSGKPFTAVMTINEKRELVITCQLAKLGDFKEENLPNVLLAALDANTRTRPFALAAITDADDPQLDQEEKWPLVLTNSVPLGDLSTGELKAAMDALWQALVTSREVLEAGLS
jgi:hypothetical protein